MLDQASIKQLTDLGIDYTALSAAIADTAEKPFPIALKTGEITVGATKLHIYDDAGHNGFKGRVKDDVLAQATELGVKAVAAKFEVDYKGNDPDKLKEAVLADPKVITWLQGKPARDVIVVPKKLVNVVA